MYVCTRAQALCMYVSMDEYMFATHCMHGGGWMGGGWMQNGSCRRWKSKSRWKYESRRDGEFQEKWTVYIRLPRGLLKNAPLFSIVR